MEDIFTYYGGLVACGNLTWYAWQVWRKKIPPTSYTSWFMWLILDVLVVLTTYAAHKPIWLPLGWTVGTAFVTWALFLQGTWKWTLSDTICAVGAVVSAVIWLTVGTTYAIIAEATSLIVAGGPLVLETAQKPSREGMPMWSINAVACAFTLLGSDWTLGGSLVAAGSGSYSLVMIYLMLRDDVYRVMGWR